MNTLSRLALSLLVAGAVFALPVAAIVAPTPTTQTAIFAQVGTPVAAVQLVDVVEGALVELDEVVLEYRAPRPAVPIGMDLLEVRLHCAYRSTIAACGYENLSTQTAFDDAWQNFTTGLAIRLKPTRRFPETVYVGSTGSTYPRYSADLTAFDGSPDLSGSSGDSWGSFTCLNSRSFTITDPTILARFKAGHPGDPGFVRMQLVGGIYGSDMSTWAGYDEAGEWHPFRYAGHDWATRWTAFEGQYSFLAEYVIQ